MTAKKKASGFSNRKQNSQSSQEILCSKATEKTIKTLQNTAQKRGT